MDYLTNMFPCVTFVPAEPESPNYVTIYPGTKCKSDIGMRGGNQAMYLNSACFDRGLIVPVHELLHTLGFVHEHNRTLVLAGSWFCYKPFWSCSKRLAMILEAQAIPLNTVLRESKRAQHNKACTGQEPFCLKVTQPINFIPKLIISLLSHVIFSLSNDI